MFALIVLVAQLAQAKPSAAMDYVRAHRNADTALVAGKLDEARAGFELCLALSPKNSTVAYALASVQARSGDSARALESLALAATWGYADADVAAWDADLAPLWKDPRFREICDRMRAAKVPTPLSVTRYWQESLDNIVTEIAVDRGGKVIAAGNWKPKVEILDGKTGELIRSFPLGPLPAEKESNPVWSVDVDGRGERFVALTHDGIGHFGRIDGKEELVHSRALPPTEDKDLPLPLGGLVLCDPTGERALIAGTERGVSLWTIQGRPLRTWDFALGYQVTPLVRWSPDGTLLALASDSSVHWIRGSDGEDASPALETPAPIASLAFDPAGKRLATGHWDSRVRVWDIETRKLLTEFEQLGTPYLITPEQPERLCFNTVAYSPDGKWLAAGTGEEMYVHVLDETTGKCRFEGGAGDMHWSEAHEVRWSPDSKRLYYAPPCARFASRDLRLDDSLPVAVQYSGMSPKISASGLAVACGVGCVVALDADSGRCLWNRTTLSSTGSLLSTAPGYFTADFDELEGLSLLREVDGGGEFQHVPLAPFAFARFDPKRVRASRDGVALVQTKP